MRASSLFVAAANHVGGRRRAVRGRLREERQVMRTADRVADAIPVVARGLALPGTKILDVNNIFKAELVRGENIVQLGDETILNPPWERSFYEYRIANKRSIGWYVIRALQDVENEILEGAPGRCYQFTGFLDKPAGIRMLSIAVISFNEYGQSQMIHDLEIEGFEKAILTSGEQMAALSPVLTSFALLNTKSFVTRGHDPNKRCQRSQRRKCPLFQYSTVEKIVPEKGSREPSGTRGKYSDSGSGPLQIIRGHIRHYGNCCPGVHESRGLLFGKETGRFWIDPFVKGTIENGEIRSDWVLRT